MSILIDENTRVTVVGLTGATARVDAERSLRYGTRIVAGVSPGKGGEAVAGIPVFDTAVAAQKSCPADVAAIYVPPAAVRDAVLEALDAGFRTLLVTAEYVPVHDIIRCIAASRAVGARLIGCNTNGVISPGKSRIGGIGGIDPSELYVPGVVGVISRSGGMSAEICLTLKQNGLGVSTCVSMGGDPVTCLSMADYALMFQNDPQTKAILLFGEPGTRNEQQVAELIDAGKITKPVLALIVGRFQEDYPPGVSFGHAGAMIGSVEDSVSGKRRMLAASGVGICSSLDDIPRLLKQRLEPEQKTVPA